MRIVLSIIAAALISGTSFSQNTGLYGRKFAVQADFAGSYPLFSLLTFNSSYKNINDELVRKSDRFDYTLHLDGTYAVKKNLGIGLHYSLNFSNMAAPEEVSFQVPDFWGGYTYESFNLQHEMFSLRTHSIIPKIEFTSFDGLIPIGLTHQVGLGVSFTKIQNKDYLYEATPYNSSSPFLTDEYFEANLYDLENFKPVKTVTLLYALNVRTPINKRMMITYGIRYTLNMGRSLVQDDYEVYYDDYGNYDADEKLITYDELAYEISRRRFRSLMELNIGMAVAL